MCDFLLVHTNFTNPERKNFCTFSFWCLWVNFSLLIFEETILLSSPKIGQKKKNFLLFSILSVKKDKTFLKLGQVSDAICNLRQQKNIFDSLVWNSCRFLIRHSQQKNIHFCYVDLYHRRVLLKIKEIKFIGNNFSKPWSL